MPVRQKLGMILENEVVQKLKLENNVDSKKWSPWHQEGYFYLLVLFGLDLSAEFS